MTYKQFFWSVVSIAIILFLLWNWNYVLNIFKSAKTEAKKVSPVGSVEPSNKETIKSSLSNNLSRAY